MNSVAIRAFGERNVAARLRDIPDWVWWVLAVAYIGVRSWGIQGVGVYGNFGDPDDATRLIEVREFMASGRWFDMTTLKFGGDAGMLSHWSRLIDLPIAGLIATFNLVMPIEDAEQLAHAVWPLALLGALLWALFKATAQVGGRGAGCLVLALAAVSPLAWYQFVVGRIDHHNAMIAATVSAAALLWAYPRRAEIGGIAGILTGLALAIGYEALAPAVALGTFVAAWAIFDRNAERCAAVFALALALTFALAFVSTIPPARWMDIRCDAISLNMVALVACGVAGLLFALGPGRSGTIGARVSMIAAGAAVGIAIFGWLEPKCLGGPKGQLPPLVLKIWLDQVAENGSIVGNVFRREFDQSLTLLLFYGAALWAQIHQLRNSRAASDRFLLATLAAFVALACWQYKYTSYACFLCLVPMAVTFSHLGTFGGISATTIRLAAIVLLNQATLSTFADGINDIAGAAKAETPQMKEDARACAKRDSIRDLADLPPGLIASHIDIGASIAALTHHRVLAAPYHRIADAIIANYEIFSAHDPKSAADILKQQDIDYIVICDGLDARSATMDEWKGTLRADLVNRTAPSYLVPVALSNPHSIYHVWRVDRAALNLQPSKAAASVR